MCYLRGVDIPSQYTFEKLGFLRWSSKEIRVKEGMASSSNAKDLNAEDFDEEDDEEHVPSSDESTEFSDDDFGSDMSGVSVDPDENEYVPSTMDKTLVDPFLNDLVQDEMDLPEISSNDEEWSPLNEYNDKGDSEDEETGVQFIVNVKGQGH
ncbi:hypothetical protein L2E82_32700 [Cichorium intybus]|uniref:Uncharacterized protein n=1 Tax=Cichorium intybus TaxID=13427 RepID=A0ACB9BIT7_CICIN|nr:hypothetical protein L2E82_32700 [Cichorium intybus]